MSHARYIVGDVFQVLATLPDDSVDMVMCSPPFLALRSYATSSAGADPTRRSARSPTSSGRPRRRCSSRAGTGPDTSTSTPS